MRKFCLVKSHFFKIQPLEKCLKLFGILRIPPFVNHKGNDVNSDWLADQWDERSVLGHAQFHKGRMKGDDPEIDTAQTPKRFDRRLALLGKPERLSLIVSRTRKGFVWKTRIPLSTLLHDLCGIRVYIVSFGNRILISIASNSWTRIECGILASFPDIPFTRIFPISWSK